MLKSWQERRVYETMIAGTKESRGSFSMTARPFPNGYIHMGTAMNNA
jgi:isoleucyl-tRNA synthetase